ncbi:MAG: bifunctional sugar-1-phosphate nucleotidylyltransferase/acetyltransferase [Candidatus Thermoplasmatota archaeon]
MKAVILCAGEGKRLEPLTLSRPKVMLKVADKPILEHIIEALSANGIRELVIVVGYKKEKIMSYFDDGKKWNVKIEYANQEKQLGTAHALLQAKEFLKNENKFLVVPGDNLIDAKSIESLIKEKAPALIFTRSDRAGKYGVVQVKEKKIIRIIEKPKEIITDTISTGIYSFFQKIFDSIEKAEYTDEMGLTNAIQFYIEHGGKINAIETKGYWGDAVYPWDLLRLNSFALRDISLSKGGRIESGVRIMGEVYIGESSLIQSGAYISGPVYIGKNSIIGPYSCIFPPTTIGDNIRIGPYTEIRGSMLLGNISIGSHSTIVNTIVDNGATIGSRFVSQSGSANLEYEEKIEKFENIGVVIGEDSNIGNCVVLDSGVIIGRNARIGPLKNVYKNVENDAIIM